MNKLPEYPRVHTNDLHVVIEYENGVRELWTETETVEEAAEIAEKMNTSLRVIKYVSSNLEDNVLDIQGYLESIGINKDIIDDAVAEGLYGISVQHFKRYWTKPLFNVEEAKHKTKNGSTDYLFEVAVLLRERENYFRDKRVNVESILKGKLDSK